MRTGYTAVTASAQTTVGTLSGWNFAENAGTPAAARVLLRDGSATGAILADIRLAASGSDTVAFPTAINVANTVYVDVATGTVRGALFGG